MNKYITFILLIGFVFSVKASECKKMATLKSYDEVYNLKN